MIIEIEGSPISKMRHRSYIAGGRIISYDPQNDAKNTMRWILQSKLRSALDSNKKKDAMEASEITRGSVFEVEINFYLPLPSSVSNRERSKLLWYGEATNKPDIDNLAKFYLDAANGILWPDDKQIVSLKILKLYSHNPKTIIRIVGSKQMSLHEKAEDILGIFTADKFEDLLEDLLQTGVDEMEILRENKNPTRHSRKLRASRAALLLSKLADKYGDELKKIKKNYPGYWQEHFIELNKMVDNCYSDGKPLC